MYDVILNLCLTLKISVDHLTDGRRAIYKSCQSLLTVYA